MAAQNSDDATPVTTHPAIDAEFAEWARAAAPIMFRTVRSRCPQLDAAELVQDALLRGWQRRETYRADRGEPLPWLLAILMDQCRQRGRRRQPVTVPFEAELRIGYRAPDPDVDLAAAIARLPAKQRGAIECHYLIGLSVAESAIVLGCREGTVRSNLSDARRNLRKDLEGTR